MIVIFPKYQTGLLGQIEFGIQYMHDSMSYFISAKLQCFKV